MNDLLEHLERWGRRGGTVAVVLCLVAVLVAAGLVWISAQPLPDGVERGRWGIAGLRFGAALLCAVALPSGLVGVRLLTQQHYPPAHEVFPPQTVEAITEQLAQRHEPLCVCSRCRVVVPAAFSTGSCPVCASSVEYHEVHSDEDASMVLAAMS